MNINIRKLKKNIPLHLMLLPAVIITVIFRYLPLMGSVMAFQNFRPTKGIMGSEFVGLANFEFIMKLPNIDRILINTIGIAFSKMALNLFIPIVFALLLNELTSKKLKRSIQTAIYIPNFLSWIILSGIFIEVLSPSEGIVNQLIMTLGFEPIYFLGDKFWFPVTMVLTDVWKTFGFGTVIYLSALTSIDPALYEASSIDGANRWQQTWNVTIPGMLPIVILMMVLSIGNVLNAGFDQIFNMYGPAVYETGDVIDTFTYRLGMVQRQYAPATAVGLFKSVVSFIFVSLSYIMADKFANYRIF